jgi:hypothetical protein
MKEYQFNKDGYYIGESENPGSTPSHNSTFTAPVRAAGYIPRWNGSAWELVENHLGEHVWIDGAETEITEYGPLPEGASVTPPPPTLEEAKEKKLAEISAAYNEFDANGTVETSAGYPIQVGQAHVTKLDGAIRFAEMTDAETIYITDADNVTHYNVSLPDAKKILMEQMGAALAAHAKKQTLRAQVEAAGTVEQVEAISWTASVSA